ncbi:hypothetical protein [Streptomyces sp. NRRL S-87]|uniref:hypothetical protein n=1 Tax=Streptomyces sp. NRRL S-87 TaxID=1463920 RepID=UPI0004BED883|nr:hypothetical protein [Streptomyces sp. NRRL S-87]
MPLTHRTAGDGVLVIRLLPALALRHRAAATLAIDELLASHRPRRLVVEIPSLLTPAATSVVLRAQHSCRARAASLAVVSTAVEVRRLLRQSLAAGGLTVYASVTQAVHAVEVLPS